MVLRIRRSYYRRSRENETKADDFQKTLVAWFFFCKSQSLYTHILVVYAYAYRVSICIFNCLKY